MASDAVVAVERLVCLVLEVEVEHSSHSGHGIVGDIVGSGGGIQ
jgi:hypothetical protein